MKALQFPNLGCHVNISIQCSPSFFKVYAILYFFQNWNFEWSHRYNVESVLFQEIIS